MFTRLILSSLLGITGLVDQAPQPSASAVSERSPFVGSWKYNAGKSRPGTGDITTYTEVADGIRVSGPEPEYTFTTDGREHPLPYPDFTISCSQIDARTWKLNIKSKGKPFEATTLKLSVDRKTLSGHSIWLKHNGEELTYDNVWERTSDGQGLIGSWRAKSAKPGAVGPLTIEAEGADGIKLTNSDFQNSISGKFDGSRGPYSSPSLSAVFFASFRRIDERTFEQTTWANERVEAISVFEVSPDGKTLKVTSRIPNSKGSPDVWIYDRQ